MRERRTFGRALGACFLAAVIVACGSDSAADQPGDSDSSTVDGSSGELSGAEPAVVLGRFFTALSENDWAATESDVDEDQLAVLTAVEGATGSEVASMLRSGVPDSVRRDFWQGFTEGLPALSELSVERMGVGSVEELSGGDTSGPAAPMFAAVQIEVTGEGEGEESAQWILQSVDGGPWRIDLFATFGAVFSPNLAAWYSELETGEDRDLIAQVIAAGAPSLRLGVDAEPLGPLGGPAVDGVDALLDAVDI